MSGRRHTGRSDRGSVMVLVALWLPVLVIFAAFAIDVAHWFDYSRNLQNRADAAALAAGQSLGACLSTPTQAQIDGIGEVAQQYSGPPSGTPSGNLPYPPPDMAAFTPYYNQPNLTAGTPGNFYLRLNQTASYPTAGVSMGSDYCHATDPTDPTVCPAATFPNGCPIVDVRLTQANLPMFIPVFGFHPNITAHARVQLEGVGSEQGTAPIAVPDPAQTTCVTAQIVDESNGNVIRWQPLSKVANSSPPTWTAPFSLPLPATASGHQLQLQALFPDDCNAPNGSGDTYDDFSNGGGIVFINTYKPLPGSVAAATVGSVWLEQRGCTNPAESPNDPYFYSFTLSSSCKVRVHAMIDFPAGPSTNGAVVTMDGANATPMTANGSLGGHQKWYADFNIAPQSGRHTFVLSWFMSSDNTCKDATKAGNSNCQFNGGNPLQETFSAFDAGVPSNDSGPVIGAHVGCVLRSPPTCPLIDGAPTDGASSGVDSIPASGAGSTPTLQATFTLQGLQNSGQTDKAILLRSSVQLSKRTAAIDCGQGNGASGLSSAIVNGCPHSLTIFNGTTCVVLSSVNPLPSGARYVGPTEGISCVEPVPGNKTGPVNGAFAQRIGTQCDNWMPYAAGTGPKPTAANFPGDTRAMQLVITSPSDMSGSAPLIHILGFATFYVTGWDKDPYLPGKSAIPGCSGAAAHDEAYPYGGNAPNGAVWGHFIQYDPVGGNPNGQGCVIGAFGDCVSALTR